MTFLLAVDVVIGCHLLPRRRRHASPWREREILRMSGACDGGFCLDDATLACRVQMADSDVEEIQQVCRRFQ
jgi:hypothetical protein